MARRKRVKHMKKILCILLALSLCLGCAACGGGYGVKVVQTLVEQEYSLAFRTGDPTAVYVMAAIEQLNYQGRVDELAVKWFGSRVVDFGKRADALEITGMPEPQDFIIGLDINSFPLAYVANGDYWGFDVEMALAVCELLGWNLKIQAIEKENVYIELSSGNIDCAWGGIALDESELERGLYMEYGPYIENNIVIAARDGSLIWNRLMLSGKIMAMPSTPEARAALETDEALTKRFHQITRLAGGTVECFEYLYSGRCDTVLTDSTALLYYNSH